MRENPMDAIYENENLMARYEDAMTPQPVIVQPISESRHREAPAWWRNTIVRHVIEATGKGERL